MLLKSIDGRFNPKVPSVNFLSPCLYLSFMLENSTINFINCGVEKQTSVTLRQVLNNMQTVPFR